MRCSIVGSYLRVAYQSYVCAASAVSAESLRTAQRSNVLLFSPEPPTPPPPPPSHSSFKRYHSEHHRYQGETGIDVDVPTPTETLLFASRPGKLLWVFLQPAFYALRPLAVVPKPPAALEAWNWLAQLAFNAAIVHTCGWQGMVYLIASTLLGEGGGGGGG